MVSATTVFVFVRWSIVIAAFFRFGDAGDAIDFFPLGLSGSSPPAFPPPAGPELLAAAVESDALGEIAEVASAGWQCRCSIHHGMSVDSLGEGGGFIIWGFSRRFAKCVHGRFSEVELLIGGRDLNAHPCGAGAGSCRFGDWSWNGYEGSMW